MIHEMIQSLERVIHERLAILRDAIRSRQAPYAPPPGQNTTTFYDPSQHSSGGLKSPLESRLEALEGIVGQCFARTNTVSSLVERLNEQAAEIAELKRRLVAPAPAAAVTEGLLPVSPLQGIEVIPKKEVAIADTTEPLSYADRLLLNKKARKALEAEEMGESVEKPMLVEETEEVEEEAEEDETMEELVEEEVEAEAEEQLEAAEEEEEVVEAESEAEEEGEALELEEFEYKGSTYYRDSDNNVYMADEDGDVNVEEPIGVWNEAKQRIVVKKPAA
jgi:hypothetical protein